jgi:phosphohistidine phosphatase
VKKLYLIRHAKSSWEDSRLSDYERPLNKRGKINAPFMGTLLYEKKVKPDLVISSPAFRAKTTAEIIAKELGYTKEILFLQDIYEGSVSSLEKILLSLNDENNSVLLFGHNPSLNMFAQQYVDFEENIPTCGVLEIEFNAKSWSKISRENARLIAFEYPKKYSSMGTSNE